jgi:predicted ABC-type ATPase
MAKVYIIAGTPGIGKSTSGKFFLPPTIEILNHDNLQLYFKQKRVIDYEELSNLKANEFILKQLELNNDFGVELNLGFDNHYELLRFIKKKYPHYEIEVVLFHTDNIQICIDRAILREKFGGHRVEIHVIEQMYKNMIPLLQNNADLVHQVQLINVEVDRFRMVYPKNKKNISIELPNWVKSLAPESLNLERF